MLQYKTERDGIVETRVEQKITIQSDGDPIDHDKALAEAIQVCVASLNCATDFTNITNSLFPLTGGHSDEPRYDSRKN